MDREQAGTAKLESEVDALGRLELVTGEVELECSSRRAEFESPACSTSFIQPNKTNRVFSAVKSDREVEQARAAGVPQKTQKDTMYCMSVWEAWKEWHNCLWNYEVFEVEWASKN